MEPIKSNLLHFVLIDLFFKSMLEILTWYEFNGEFDTINRHFQTLARGQINLDDIIQLPPTNPFTIKLFQTEKDSKDSRQIQIGTLEISEVSSIPTEDDDAKYVSDSSD
jgi:hypothetical protein